MDGSESNFITTSTFANNSAGIGGAFFVATSNTLNIIDCSIYENTAVVGGGFYVAGFSSLFAYFTDFNDSSYECDGAVVLDCCATPPNICGDIINESCPPVVEKTFSWGSIKALYR